MPPVAAHQLCVVAATTTGPWLKTQLLWNAHSFLSGQPTFGNVRATMLADSISQAVVPARIQVLFTFFERWKRALCGEIVI